MYQCVVCKDTMNFLEEVVFFDAVGEPIALYVLDELELTADPYTPPYAICVACNHERDLKDIPVVDKHTGKLCMGLKDLHAYNAGEPGKV